MTSAAGRTIAEVLVTDNEGTTDTATDSQFVSVVDVLPTVELYKGVTPALPT